MADGGGVNVKVVVRCRPTNGKEREMGSKKIVKINERDGTVELIRPNNYGEDDDGLPKAFKFDHVRAAAAPPLGNICEYKWNYFFCLL